MVERGQYDVDTDIGKILECQSLYTVIKTDREDSIKLMILDYRKLNENDYGVELMENEIVLHRKLIELKNDSISSVINYLNNEFVKLAEIQGDKNNHLELDYEELVASCDLPQFNHTENDLDLLIKRRILTKFIFSSNLIATKGRIGPSQYMISNKKTNEFLLENEVLTSENKFIVDTQLEEGKVILGRKTQMDQPGIILTINENSFNDIVYNEEGKKCVNLLYSFSKIGYNPEKQYLTMNIKNKF